MSTLKEADEFFEAGFDDILYAVGIVPNKLPHVLALCRRGCALKLIVDSRAAAQAVVDFGRAHGQRFEVLGRIRQESMNWAHANGSHYFVIDCDNFARPDALAELHAANLPIVAPLLHSRTVYSCGAVLR